jgi:hypothetical protein
MKPTSEIFAICDYASVDRDGKLSIMGIFREMYVNKMPAYIAHFYVAASIKGDPEKSFDVNIEVTSPNGKLTIPKQEVTVQIGIGGMTNLVTDIINLPLEITGDYKITLKMNNGHVVGTRVFRVLDLQTPQASVN